MIAALGRALAGCCALWLVVAGLLSVRSDWHGLFHHHPITGSVGDHAPETDHTGHGGPEGPENGESHEAGCFLCTLVHQQLDGVFPPIGPAHRPEPRGVPVAMVAVSESGREVWAGVSGRGPPAWV